MSSLYAQVPGGAVPNVGGQPARGGGNGFPLAARQQVGAQLSALRLGAVPHPRFTRRRSPVYTAPLT